MKLFRPTIFFLLIFYSSYSQIEIRGTVLDSSNAVVEFANVVLTNQNNEIIKGTITDEKGKFTIKTDKKGAFKLTISFIGFIDFVKNLKSSIDLGNVILKSNNELDEVVIRAKKPIIKREVDRLVFDVENSIAASGGDALDVLKVTLGLRVDNDQISMIGKTQKTKLFNSLKSHNGRFLLQSCSKMVNLTSI